ncbi:MAG: hypothetical protein U0798_00450 [Gemmataceae bacterium]
MKRFVYLFVFVGLLAMVGCGSSNSLKPTQMLAVTIDGKPAVGMNITFLDEANKIVGSGSTGSDGKVAIRGKNDQPIGTGNYKVIVSDIGEAEENPMVSQKAQKSRLPNQYGNPNQTPLKITIEQGKMDYTVEIKTTK